MEKEVKKIVIFVFAAIFIAHFWATAASWYWNFPWFDIPMHFFGGFWVVAVFAYLNLRFSLKIFEGKNLLTSLILAVSFAALIGVFWEFFEFLLDFFKNSMDISKMAQMGIADTMGDLFFDLVGGTAFILLFQKFFKQ